MASLPPVAKKILRYWEWPFVAALAAFMFWVRMLPYRALVGGERAYFIGTDPFYHYREVLGITRSFPRVPRWDPWTFYPNGTGTGQFGSLFDWVAAVAAIITGGAQPSELHVQQVLGVFPAVLGTLLVIPFYFLAKRLLGQAGAVMASVALALLPGEFLIRSIAGYSDHHVAEALMAVVAILALVVAAERSQAQREKLVDLRDIKAYKGPLAWSILAGFAIAADLYTWPPAILFLAILTLWLTIVIIFEHGNGRTPRGFVFAGVVAFITAGLLMIPSIETYNLGEFNTYGILHPISAFLAAAGLVVVHKLGKTMRMRGISPWVLPGAVAGVAVVGFFSLKFIDPQTFNAFMWGLSWVTGIGVQRTTLTIAEARPARYFCSGDTQQYSCLASDFGLLAPLFVLTFFVLLAFVLWKRRRQDILLLIWSFAMMRATGTQIRFSYYVAINIALLFGWIAARLSYGIGLEHEEKVEKPKPVTRAMKGRKTRTVEAAESSGRWAKVGVVVAVALLMLPGNVFALESTGARPGWQSAEIRQPDGDLVLWLQGLDWMRANTPDAGVDLGLIVNAPPPGEHYVYPPETYGVLSWWDYGHWIETTALRPPVANPFQQAAPFASLYFTERDTAAAEARLDAWTEGVGPIRYVIIDDAMATGKYGAITVWANSQDNTRPVYAGGDYIIRSPYVLGGVGTQELPTMGPAYTSAMMGRLYDVDGQGLPNYRLVWEHPSYAALGSVVNLDSGLRCLHDTIPSRQCAVGLTSAQVQNYVEGTGVLIGERTYAYDLKIVSRLKLFERVPGATLTGTAQPGERVEATVELAVQHADGSGRRWTHTVAANADATGAFSIQFPYSTVDPVAPADGGTTLLVRASAPAFVGTATQNTRIDIPDRAVLQGETIAVTFG